MFDYLVNLFSVFNPAMEFKLSDYNPFNSFSAIEARGCCGLKSAIILPPNVVWAHESCVKYKDFYVHIIPLP